ncbi:Vacuolar protein-sorting-associated protein 27, partial [Gonapodya sp. JEL0774]
VCDGCYGRLTGDELLGGGGAKVGPPPFNPLANSYYPGTSGPSPLAAVDPLDADIQRAIQLSLAESSDASPAPERKIAVSSAPSKPKDDDLARKENEDLERAIAESLKEVTVSSTPRSTSGGGKAGEAQLTVTVRPNPNALTEVEIDNVRLFGELVEKLEEEGAGGRSWQDGPVGGEAVEALHHQIALLQPKLVSNLTDAVQKYRLFVSFNTKLEQALRTYDHMLNKRLESARNAGVTVGGGYGGYGSGVAGTGTPGYPSLGAGYGTASSGPGGASGGYGAIYAPYGGPTAAPGQASYQPTAVQ